ncbi:MAG: metallophosphoesterase [Phycisphaerales bacterium]|nr:MAG: metallophosphoesterase [Phycisphaerales bacterium]
MPQRLHRSTIAAVYAVMLVLVLAGCGRPPGFSFDVTCDVRAYTPPAHPGNQYFLGACEAIRDLGPGAFMISAGDMEPPDRVRAALDGVFGPDYAWYNAVGNHEGDKPEYMSYMREYNRNGTALPRIVRPGPPGAVETCYSFDYQDVHFVAVNQYYDGTNDMAPGGGTVSDSLYEWLANDLAATDKRRIFVFGHEPAFVLADMDNGRVRHLQKSLDKHPDRRHRFWSLLRKHGVTAFICGHDHNASVANIHGVWQIDAGHARGKGDPGALSTFVKIYVTPPAARCEVYRADENGENYTRTYSTPLN